MLKLTAPDDESEQAKSMTQLLGNVSTHDAVAEARPTACIGNCMFWTQAWDDMTGRELDPNMVS